MRNAYAYAWAFCILEGEGVVAEQMVEMNVSKKDLPKLLDSLEKDMHKAAKLLDFERAIQLRDEIKKIKSLLD